MCRECGEPGEKSNTDVICPECDAVLDDAIVDQGPEWREYGVEDISRRRTGPSRDTTRGDLGLGSQIGTHHERQSSGFQLARAHRYHQQTKTRTRRDERREYACNEITRMSAALGVGECLEEQAHHLFKQVHNGDHLIGRDLDTIAAACLYLVNRIHGRGLTADDMEDVARTDERWIHRRSTALVRELDLEVPPPSLESRVRRVASAAGIEARYTSPALELADEVADSPVVNGSPSAIAAAILYEITKGDYTQEEIGEAAGCSATTLRHRWRDVQEVVDG